ncbi:MAG: hypothetical protein Q9227_001337 [Pyrenula ochraceoflavens]
MLQLDMVMSKARAVVLASFSSTLQSQAEKVDLYENLLLKLLPRQDQRLQEIIQSTLERGRTLSSKSPGLESLTDIQPSSESFVQTPGTELSEPDNEFTRTGRSGSPNSSDQVQFDTASFSRDSGFLGKASTVRMMEEVREKLANPVEFGAHGLNISQSSPYDEASGHSEPLKRPPRGVFEGGAYYMTEINEDDEAGFGENAENLDMRQMPLHEQANKYLDYYFATVNNLFPIVLEPVFRRQYSEFQATGVPPWPHAPLQVMFNLVFALGALHAELIGSSTWDGRKDNHVAYFFRARMLSFEPLKLLQMPELYHVQMTALFGMYLVASNQLNRAYLMCGIAVRQALVRGLHLINVSPGVSDAQLELEVRIWHSVCSLERLTCFLTGRPSACLQNGATTREPSPLSTDSALGLIPEQISVSGASESNENSLESFCMSIRLDEILRCAFTDLYLPSVVEKSWVSIQGTIDTLNRRLFTWRARLPQRLVIHHGSMPKTDGNLIECVYLALRYFSACITVNRPCLCDADGLEKAIPSQSFESKSKDQENALRCIAAARDMVHLFVPEPHGVELFRNSPWWCILHYVAQATTILIMEISFQGSHFGGDIDILYQDTEQALKCLEAMAQKNETASRVHSALKGLFNMAWSHGTSTQYPMRLTNKGDESTAIAGNTLTEGLEGPLRSPLGPFNIDLFFNPSASHSLLQSNWEEVPGFPHVPVSSSQSGSGLRREPTTSPDPSQTSRRGRKERRH